MPGGDPAAFAIGANLPWVGYGTDFGASAWSPSGGLAADAPRRARLDEAFARLASDGLSIVRLFVLCDARSGLRFDADGLPISLDDAFFDDFDALLASARDHDIRVMPVLLDFHLCNPARIADGVQLGGRSHLVLTGEGRSALVESVVASIARRYGNDDRVTAWDVMNEPEWCLQLAASRGTPDAFGALQTFLADAVAALRAHAGQPVTIGCAGTWQLDLVRPLGLDFYQIHWYEKFGWARLAQPVSQFALDRPVLLGEFSGRTARMATLLDTARHAGYCGALVWSVLADDDASGYPGEFLRRNVRPARG